MRVLTVVDGAQFELTKSRRPVNGTTKEGVYPTGLPFVPFRPRTQYLTEGYRQAVALSKGMMATVIGVHTQLVLLAASQPAERRWGMFGKNGKPLEVEEMARLLLLDVGDVEMAVGVMLDERVGWLRWETWVPKGPKVEIPGVVFLGGGEGRMFWAWQVMKEDAPVLVIEPEVVLDGVGVVVQLGKMVEWYEVFGHRLDVMGELVAARQFLRDKPEGRKGAGEVVGFLNSWMKCARVNGTARIVDKGKFVEECRGFCARDARKQLTRLGLWAE